MTMDSLTTKIQQLPDELMRSIYLYIPDRLPFKDELLEARLRVEHKIHRVCDGRMVFRRDKYIINLYYGLKWGKGTMSDLRKIATEHKIKGRSKLKTRSDFIHAFLKNDV